MPRLPLRALLKRPGTSALAVVALALGIGLTTTMFGIVTATPVIKGYIERVTGRPSMAKVKEMDAGFAAKQQA
jgi:ABC-type nickel/cobalt efflux system permease component RcnA